MKGEVIDVRARIRQLDLYSGHADGPETRQLAEEAPAGRRHPSSWCMAR